ncbi:MAG: porphobilinogen synthase [Methanosarcinales archaeon]|nr:porphobilinogen synthase [Methanosarcinales archaeon]
MFANTTKFPTTRLRRLRMPAIRRMVKATTLSVDDLIAPLFIDENLGTPLPISSMPGVRRETPASVVDEAKTLADMGVPAVVLFGIPKEKDETGTHAYGDDDVVQNATRDIKAELGDDMVVITDLCLCEYTTHGHCGMVDYETEEVLNDPTLPLLGKTAVSQARAGADIVAPSGMMDGMVAAIRGALDAGGFTNTPIMSYAAKYSSSFYGPFRDAAESGYSFGDRSTYQMDPANSDEAIREVEQDILEGADIVMVKPALPYLDIIYRVKHEFKMPTAAYNVSGEYSMVRGAVDKGWLDEMAIMESLISIKRAGADMILTYFAKDVALTLNE